MRSKNSNGKQDSCVDLVRGYLEKYGWTYELIDQDMLVTGFYIDENVFTVFIRCIEEMVYFSIPNFASLVNDEFALTVYQYLLEANLYMQCGKFGLDEKGKIGLYAEFPVSVVSYDLFSFTLNSIGMNANDLIQKDIRISQYIHFDQESKENK
jgi:hypothetical protein